MAPILQAATERDPTAELRQAIVDGVFHPNERLVEEDLALRFQTKRSSIRAALTVLAQERLVVHERNRGARVRLVTIEEAAEILECRAVIEGLVARKAAERIDAGGIATLRSIVADMKKYADDGDVRAYSECNGRFHGALLAVAHHTAAEHLLVLLTAQIVRHQYRSALSPGRPTQSLREHAAVLDAVVAGDGAAAENAMRAHILNVTLAVREGASTQFP
jgi:DNA-binding GntR family transcriptional regulator